MKIVHQDENRLMIKNGSINWLAGFIFLILGLVILFKPDFINTEIPWWFGVFIISIGGVSVIFPTRDFITFDKSENKLRITQKSMVEEKNNAYELNTIRAIELWAFRNQGTNNRNNSLQYTLACMLENGDPVILNPTSSSSSRMSIGSMTWNFIPEKMIGEKIAAFLNIPFSENRRPPTVTETLNVLSETVKTAMEKHSNQNKS